jgi:ATP-binding cassette subfamily E protein 1
MRIAAVEIDQCRPEKCGELCIRVCPVERVKPETIIISQETKKAKIDENLCIGCGICVYKCPYSAISVINLPDKWSEVIVHKYQSSGFSLFWLPQPKQASVLGILGKNGAGKTTALRILTGEIIPNLGGHARSKSDIIDYFRGKEFQRYFSDLYSSRLKVAVKPQYLDHLKTDVVLKEYLSNVADHLIQQFKMNQILDRRLNELSGGELQKAAILNTVSQDASAYFFDEPASFLDVKERFMMSKTVRSLAKKGKYVVVVEHDLIVLDYLSDYVTLVYGEAGGYGYFSNPYSTRTGINHFLKGYLPDQNMRIRDYEILFTRRGSGTFAKSDTVMMWPETGFSYSSGFELKISQGSVSQGSVVGIIGENGIGKSTFVRSLNEYFKENYYKGRRLGLALKPQTLSPNFAGTVEELFKKNPGALDDELYISNVYSPLEVQKLSQKLVAELSGGELQRVAVAYTLSLNADVYLLDEPSAYLDAEQRLVVSKAIKKTIENRGRVAFVVDHDLSLIDYVSDTLVLISGEPGVRGFAQSPVGLKDGLNSFLRDVGLTFRRDKESGRPRVNKEGSYLDRYQKETGEYFYESPIHEPSEEAINN